ncbi:unnamed protein product [Linum tenue]|uniref:Uncharacterized protein n=1 Tax=Linum tenue TaxID=586396 RepID=A0AAV0LHZ2_9ROSI|nr:unnamed protein product [Linum tenue]
MKESNVEPLLLRFYQDMIHVDWSRETSNQEDQELIRETNRENTIIANMAQVSEFLDARRQFKSKPPRSINASIKDEGLNKLVEAVLITPKRSYLTSIY